MTPAPTGSKTMVIETVDAGRLAWAQVCPSSAMPPTRTGGPRKPAVIDFELAGTRSAHGRIENFNVTTPFSPDLAHLVGLLAASGLEAQVGWCGP